VSDLLRFSGCRAKRRMEECHEGGDFDYEDSSR
jgi:hypothetical protein